MDLTSTSISSQTTQKEAPLWIFPVSPHLNNLHQIDILEEDLNNMNFTRDVTVTYPRTIHVKVLEPLELTESDAPGFLYLISIMRVTLPYLLFREHSVTWPYIRGFTQTLPLAGGETLKNAGKDQHVNPLVQVKQGSSDQVDNSQSTTPKFTRSKGNGKS
jgi:hypothetical protein